MKGVFNILATPFDEQGRIDEESLRSLVEFQIKAGAAGLTILGIMGEVAKLSDSERDQVTRVVLEQVNGRIPVVVNTTHTGTHVVIETSQRVAAMGAAGIMLAPPTNLRNLDSVADFYRSVAAAVKIPVVVQDEPVTTGVIMPASFLAGLSLPYIKLEEAPVPQKLSRIREKAPNSRIFGGLGGQYFLEELERGAVGTMTGFAFTEILGIYTDFMAGRHAEARETFYKHMPLIRYEGQAGVGLAIRKEILRRRGAIRCAAIRAPGMRLDAQALREIDSVLGYVGLG
jgi:4-hydroxy-tetrahydrodipicolinate synthase